MKRALLIWLMLWSVVSLYSGQLHAQSTPQKVLQLFDDLPVDDAEGQSVLKKGETAAKKITRNIFVKALLSKQQCYIGEPILLQYKLYTAVQSRSELSKLPLLNHFAAYAMPNVQEQPQYEEIGNQKFKVYDLAAWQLLPFTAGVLPIDPLSVQHQVAYENDLNNKVAYSGVTSSETLTLQVLELPLPGKGISASDAIGNFNITANYETDTMVADALNQLHLIITGTGNFNNVTLPQVNWPAVIQVFPAKEKMEVDFEKFPAAGAKHFSIPFVITEPGEYKIPGYQFTFFNADAKAYQTQDIPGKTIYVKTAAVTSPQAIRENSNHTTEIWVGLTVSFFLLLFIIGMLAYLKHKTKKRKTVVIANPVIKTAIVVNHFHGLSQLEAIANNDQYVLEVKEYLAENFIQANAASGSIFKNAAGNLVNNCNYLLFSPGTISMADRQQLSDAVKEFCNTYKELISEPSSLLN